MYSGRVLKHLDYTTATSIITCRNLPWGWSFGPLDGCGLTILDWQITLSFLKWLWNFCKLGYPSTQCTNFHIPLRMNMNGCQAFYTSSLRSLAVFILQVIKTGGGYRRPGNEANWLVLYELSHLPGNGTWLVSTIRAVTPFWEWKMIG